MYNIKLMLYMLMHVFNQHACAYHRVYAHICFVSLFFFLYGAFYPDRFIIRMRCTLCCVCVCVCLCVSLCVFL